MPKKLTKAEESVTNAAKDVQHGVEMYFDRAIGQHIRPQLDNQVYYSTTGAPSRMMSIALPIKGHRNNLKTDIGVSRAGRGYEIQWQTYEPYGKFGQGVHEGSPSYKNLKAWKFVGEASGTLAEITTAIRHAIDTMMENAFHATQYAKSLG